MSAATAGLALGYHQGHANKGGLNYFTSYAGSSPLRVSVRPDESSLLQCILANIPLGLPELVTAEDHKKVFFWVGNQTYNTTRPFTAADIDRRHAFFSVARPIFLIFEQIEGIDMVTGDKVARPARRPHPIPRHTP